MFNSFLNGGICLFLPATFRGGAGGWPIRGEDGTGDVRSPSPWSVGKNLIGRTTGFRDILEIYIIVI